jgi:hypothetical protein
MILVCFCVILILWVLLLHLDKNMILEQYLSHTRIEQFSNNPFNDNIAYIIQISGQNSPGDGAADLCLHAVGGSRQGNNIALHGGVEYNKGNANGTFYIKQVGTSSDGKPYYIIQVSGQNSPENRKADLCLHALGGSRQGNNIALHGGVGYNTGNANGTFFIKQVGTSSDDKPYYVIQVSGGRRSGDGMADLCLHALGGSRQGNNIALHGGVGYNTGNPNGTFFIKPAFDIKKHKYTIFKDYDLNPPQGGVDIGAQNNVSQEECGELCDKINSCKGFTYRSTDRRCWLKSSTDLKFKDTDNLVSGIKAQPIVEPCPVCPVCEDCPDFPECPDCPECPETDCAKDCPWDCTDCGEKCPCPEPRPTMPCLQTSGHLLEANYKSIEQVNSEIDTNDREMEFVTEKGSQITKTLYIFKNITLISICLLVCMICIFILDFKDVLGPARQMKEKIKGSRRNLKKLLNKSALNKKSGKSLI